MITPMMPNPPPPRARRPPVPRWSLTCDASSSASSLNSTRECSHECGSYAHGSAVLLDVVHHQAREVLDGDAGDVGVEAVAGAFLVVEVDRDDGRGHRADGEVAGVDVVDEAAAHGVRLEAHGGVQVGAGEAEVPGVDVPDAAGHLAADGHPAVAGGEVAVLDQDPFAGHVHPAAVGVAAGLDRDAVVAGVEGAAADD